MKDGAVFRDEAQDIVNRVRQALTQPQVGAENRLADPIRYLTETSSRGFDFGTLPEYELLKLQKAAGEIAGIENPFYRLHDGRAAETTSLDGREVVNFSSYDYLGLNGHPDVIAAAKSAIDHFGTSVSASRLTAGERQVHRDLETALAKLHGVEDAVAFVSGHATNVSVIGGLLRSGGPHR